MPFREVFVKTPCACVCVSLGLSQKCTKRSSGCVCWLQTSLMVFFDTWHAPAIVSRRPRRLLVCSRQCFPLLCPLCDTETPHSTVIFNSKDLSCCGCFCFRSISCFFAQRRSCFSSIRCFSSHLSICLHESNAVALPLLNLSIFTNWFPFCYSKSPLFWINTIPAASSIQKWHLSLVLRCFITLCWLAWF